jgi:hypothetical protein
MEDSFMLTATVIVIFGLLNHFLIEAKPADLLSNAHKLFPFVYWSAVAAIVTVALKMVNAVVHDAMVTAAVAVTGMGLGTSIGHLVVEYLRERDERRLDDSYRRAYALVFGKEDGPRDGRRSPQEQSKVPDVSRV